MVNDLQQLLRENVADAPPDHVDVASIVSTGRRRVRTRRTTAYGGVAIAVAGIVAATALGGSVDGDRSAPADTPPRPDAPTLRITDARPAVEGRDYEVLASYTNEDLDADNGQYLEGVTDDGAILFRDGPRADQRSARFALLDPATGDKDWLPDPAAIGSDQSWPVELGADRLVLLSLEDGSEGDVQAHVFDRATRRWRTMTWPGLPAVEFPRGTVGPDGRLYLRVPGTGDEERSYALWSASLTDTADSRDESLTVGDVAFTESSMVWTDAAGGGLGRVHVRDVETGEEHSFDPRSGARCDLQTLGASGDRIVMGQQCGIYDEGRDDRVQILTTDGDQVVTIQDDGLDGWLPAGADVVQVSAYGGRGSDRTGTYVYDLRTDRLLRVSEDLSSWEIGRQVGNPRQFFWHTPVNQRRGDEQHLGELLP